jgi:phosphate-selective porin OprO and OprP
LIYEYAEHPMIASLLSLALFAAAPPEPESNSEPEPSTKPDPQAIYEAVTKVVKPTALLEADYRQHADPVEGNSGFALARARLGLQLKPTDWMTATATIELAPQRDPLVLDGNVRFDATPWLEITVGYSKPPLFASFRHEPVMHLSMPMRSVVVTQMFVRRDVGVEARFVPRRAPIEAIVRLGNGSRRLLNDTPTPSGYGALDLVLGRAWESGRTQTYGLRLGAAALIGDTPEHESIAGATPLGYVYTQPVTAVGLRTIATAHAVVYAGPVQLVVESGFVQEARADDHDSDPSTPALTLDPVRNYGLTTELTWTIRGGWRAVGKQPKVASLRDKPWDGGAVELVTRADRFWLGYGAAELFRTGGTTVALASKWWPTQFLSLALYGDATIYDAPPADGPDRRWGWTALLRASFFWGWG